MQMAINVRRATNARRTLTIITAFHALIPTPGHFYAGINTIRISGRAIRVTRVAGVKITNA